MASILDLARCSKAVYDDLPSVNGWMTERVFSFHALGFFACLFRRDGEAVFAIRGTDDLLDVFNDLQLAAGTLPIQHAPARAALSKAYQESAVPSKNFILTGHSLARISHSYSASLAD